MRNLILCLIPLALCAQTAQYPASVAGDNALSVQTNGVQTSLLSPITLTNATSMVVMSSVGIVPNQILTVDGERIWVCTVVGNTLTIGKSSCPNVDGRGIDGSTAATHAAGAGVYGYIAAWSHNALKSEIQAIETTLGPNLANVNVGYTNIAGYGAVCNGTDQNTAVQAAIATGAKNIYIPKGCMWVPPGNAIPGGLTFIGEDGPTTIISAQTPASQSLSVGSLAQLRNFTYKSQDCMALTYYSAGCQVDFVANSASTAQTLLMSPREHFIWLGSDLTEQGVFGNIYANVSDGMFVQNTAASAGIRIWNNSNNSQQRGMLIERRGIGPGLVIITDAGGAASGPDLNIFSSDKTAGSMIQFDHNASAFAGDIITASMANGTGSFTGNFNNFLVNNVSKWKVDSGGNATSAGVVAGAALQMNTNYLRSGAGSPQGVMVGNPGDLYVNTSGGAGTTLYVKESGVGTNTGWVGK